MAFVAFICAMSGLIYGSETIQNATIASWLDESWLRCAFVLAYAFLVYPYFYSRHACVEGPSPTRSDLQDRGGFVPVFFFIFLLAILTMLLTAGLLQFGNRHELWLDMATLLLAVSPFAYLGILTYRNLIHSKTSAQEERLFRSKVLFPAFATCLISFVFGWTLSRPTATFLNHVFPIVIPIALIVLGRAVIAKKGLIWSFYFVVAAIVATFLISQVRIPGSEVGRAILTGIVLTFAMGVAEVCKRTVWINQGRKFVTAEPNEDGNFYLAGSNWASISFPLLLIFLPLLNSEIAVGPIFAISAIQYLHWHFLTPKKESKWLARTNIVLGFSLPIVLCVQYVFFPVTTPMTPNRILDFWPLLAVYLTLLTSYLLAIWDRKRLVGILSHLNRKETYLAYDNCFLFFLINALFISILITLFALVATTTLGYDVQLKATKAIAYLFLLTVVACVLFYIQRSRMSGNSPRTRSQMGRSSGRQNNIGQKYLRAFLSISKVARLPVAIIAGLPVSIVLALRTSLEWPTIISQALPIVATTMAGFIINDIYDAKKDKYSSVSKAIAAGKISSETAACVAVFLIAVAVTLAAGISRGASLFVIIAAIVGVSLYSVLAYHLPVFKGFITGTLSCAPFAYAAEISGLNIYASCYILLVVFIAGRELLLDVRDFKADQKANINTLVYYLQPTTSRVLGWMMMAGSIIAVAFYARGIALIWFIATLVSLLLCLVFYSRDESLSLALSRVSLLCGVVGTACLF